MDKANRVMYDFSSILYLSDSGSDFTGGRLVFLDKVAGAAVTPTNTETEARVPGRGEGCSDNGMVVVRSAVAPAKGRFVAFTSGLENIHHVRRLLIRFAPHQLFVACFVVLTAPA